MNRDVKYLLLGVFITICFYSYSYYLNFVDNETTTPKDAVTTKEDKSRKITYNPVLHSADDITIQLLQKILNGEVDTLTIDYDFTRCIKDNESQEAYRQNSVNLFVLLDEMVDDSCDTEYDRNCDKMYKILFPVKLTSNVTTLACAFKDNKHLEYINLDITSSVVDMTSMFENAKNFRGVLNMNNWDVSNVTSMSNMFKFAEKFDSNISKWDTSNVKDMSGMFYMTKFDQDISKWNTANVVDMTAMFYRSKFNYNINDWDTSNVKNMREMFYYSRFDQSIGDWNTGNVVDMSYMFASSEFNQPINNWKTSKVKNFSRMFKESKFNQPIGNWDTSSAEDMSFMFLDNKVFNQPLSKWKTSNVKTFTYMFAGTPFNNPIGNWDTSSAEDMSYMFYNDKDFNQSLSHWDTSKVINMTAMFMFASKFEQDISNWSFASLKYSDQIFYDNYSKYRPQIKKRIAKAVSKNMKMYRK